MCALMLFRCGEEKGHVHKGGNGTVACGTSNVGIGKWQNPPCSISLIAAFLQDTSKESMPPSTGVYRGQVTLTVAIAGGLLLLGRL